MARLRVGVLGLSHDHVWGILAALAAGDVGTLAAVGEPDARLHDRLRREHGSVDLHGDFDAVLARPDLDAVFVFSDNRTSAELGVRALDRGLPVMIEKPMAADLAGADALLAVARRRGTPLMVNWPTAWRSALRHGLTLARSGAIGEPVQVSHRGGHAGPREYGCSPQFCEWLYDPARNGGGALADYCGYGAILCRTLLGRPVAVSAVAAHLRKEGLSAEDNAIVVLRYPRALALLEASWTQIGGEPAFAMTVYGDAGTLIVHQARASREGQTAGAGSVQIVTREGSRQIEPPPLPPDARDGPTYFLSRLQAGQPIEGLCDPEIGRDAQEIIEAALRSAASGRQEVVPRP
jgi:predicted dehydrogenase